MTKKEHQKKPNVHNHLDFLLHEPCRYEQKAEYRELNKEKIREQKREYNKKKRAICLEYLGGKCVKCGTTERLEFDHIKRDTKKYNIAPRVTYNFNYLKEELDKCQLLCAPCHLDKTASEWTK